jgi:hypothetical protein
MEKNPNITVNSPQKKSTLFILKYKFLKINTPTIVCLLQKRCKTGRGMTEASGGPIS